LTQANPFSVPRTLPTDHALRGVSQNAAAVSPGVLFLGRTRPVGWRLVFLQE